jgi:excisionase family DNA binding protein
METEKDNLGSLGTDVMTIEEAAEFLRVSQKTTQRLAKRKELPARKVGSLWRFSRLRLTEWMQDV